MSKYHVFFVVDGKNPSLGLRAARPIHTRNTYKILIFWPIYKWRSRQNLHRSVMDLLHVWCSDIYKKFEDEFQPGASVYQISLLCIERT